MSWAKTCSASIWNPPIPIIILIFFKRYISTQTRCIILSAIKSSVWGTNPWLIRSLVENMSSEVSKRMTDFNAGIGEALSRVRHRSCFFTVTRETNTYSWKWERDLGHRNMMATRHYSKWNTWSTQREITGVLGEFDFLVNTVAPIHTFFLGTIPLTMAI